MALTSISYAIFVIVAVTIYYMVPPGHQWKVLLIASSIYYIHSSRQYALFMLFTIISVYAGARIIDRIANDAAKVLETNRAKWDRDERKRYRAGIDSQKRTVLSIVLTLNFGILFMLKYYGAIAASIVGHDVGGDILLPLGISFYTFISTGYLIDVYRGNVDAEHNPLRFALFVSFFPQIIQGPISSYKQLGEQLGAHHKLEWQNFKSGFEIILWGLFKKLVIADRAYIAIKAYHDNGGLTGTHDMPGYGGTMVLFITVLYALQLYADFSGGIDIARGICRILDIDLAVNFRRPYFSQSLSEYWRRWHITLGDWMKNYVFYPLAMSKVSMRISKKIATGRIGESKLGQHIAKVLPSAVASMIIFLLIGIWHGANVKYIGFGIWNGSIIMISVLLAPVYDRVNETLHIDTDSIMWKLWRMLRTFVLVLVGYIFDIADGFTNAIDMLMSVLMREDVTRFMTEWRTLGLRKLEYITLMSGALIVLYMSIRMEQSDADDPSEILSRRSGIVEWAAVFIMIMIVLILGIYGPSYDPAEFIYMQF